MIQNFTVDVTSNWNEIWIWIIWNLKYQIWIFSWRETKWFAGRTTQRYLDMLTSSVYKMQLSWNLATKVVKVIMLQGYYSFGRTLQVHLYLCMLIFGINDSSSPSLNSLTHFSPVSHFYTPWKRQKNLVFWRFQGVKKCDTGLKWLKISPTSFLRS